MKKLFIAIISIICILAVIVCSSALFASFLLGKNILLDNTESALPENKLSDEAISSYCGTWIATSLYSDGVTVNLLLYEGTEDYKIYLVLESDGKAIMQNADDTFEGKWSESENGILMDDGIEAVYEDGKLCVAIDDIKIYFEKLSAIKSEETTKYTTPDYANAALFEADLNAGMDLTGKTVTINVDKFVPNSAFGYNIQTGEHLNFCSANHPGVSEGDTITVRVDTVTSFLTSYIISYTIIDTFERDEVPAFGQIPNKNSDSSSSSQAFPKEEKDETMPSAPAVTTAPQTTALETASPPVTTVTDTPADESDEISPASGIVYVKDNVNVRKGPGTTFERVGHLNKGEKVEITGKAENGWYRIKFNDGEYFVSGNYLTEEQPAQSSASTETPSISTIAKPETTSPPTTKAPETAPSITTQKRLTEDDIRPEFKELMDQYEAFFDDYIAFMKKYLSASSDDPMAMLGMLQDYLDWLEKYSEVMEDFEDVGDSDLTRAEAFYYAEVSLRIEEKLLSVMY